MRAIYVLFLMTLMLLLLLLLLVDFEAAAAAAAGLDVTTKRCGVFVHVYLSRFTHRTTRV